MAKTKTKSAAPASSKSRPAALATPTDLGSNSARSVAETLNGILADSYALYFKTKNFHWHVSGPHFRDYHLMLDEQATQILGTTDAIAERVRKTGNTTLRSIGDIARRQTIADNDKDFVSAAEMLAELREDNLKLVESLREAKDIVDEAKDNATSGILDDWTDQAEERAWFLFEASRKG
ncbi:DNA starvation/stationary phase protection protein [Sphingomonas gilva]|uniref:DNA starvation/stationary phase protection protein n=1 Tax=Sphingomonas gilva TaxID=2305907 RepID=A0A396RQI0_9SPHN|nr:DNA starvation/stationary phase protection protein [Sphingomonas gilva]RHW18760.1 DNA starvation/stationary phase protection protein [Sphingomonas gilva]